MSASGLKWAEEGARGEKTDPLSADDSWADLQRRGPEGGRWQPGEHRSMF